MSLPKRNANEISGLLFLVGLAITAMTHAWWPYSMFFLALMLVPQLMVGGRRSWFSLQAFFLFVGVGALDVTNSWWPDSVIVFALMALVGYLARPLLNGRREAAATAEERPAAAVRETAGAPPRASAAPEPTEDLYIRARLEKALVYRASIDDLTRRVSGAKRALLEEAAAEMDKGIEAIRSLARRAGSLKSNPVVLGDIKTAPKVIAQMEERLAAEQDPDVYAELERALRSKRMQLHNLRHLESVTTRADIQIDNMLAAMGTLYAQMQLIDAQDIDSSSARRLFDDVSEQVEKTQDMIYAMEEVYRSSAT
ncbi:MAG: hypothetical protein JXB47_03020 [Anaerolineae bacterium]|nr:hypothetical protein [Anaerolineae bacterium]